MYQIYPITCSDQPAPGSDDTIIALDEEQTRTYYTAAAGALGHLRYLDAGVASILVVHETGYATLFFTVDGMICNNMVIGPEPHAAGMEAALGRGL